MASKKLGEAYLEIKIKEKLASDMAKAKSKIQKELDKASMSASRINIKNQRAAIREGERLAKQSTKRQQAYYSMVAKRSRVNRARGERQQQAQDERRKAFFAKVAQRSSINRERTTKKTEEAAARSRELNTLLAKRRIVNRERANRKSEEAAERTRELNTLLARRSRINRERTARQAGERAANARRQQLELDRASMSAARTEIRRRRNVARQVAVDARRTAVRNRQVAGQVGTAAAGIGVASTAVLSHGVSAMSEAMQQLFMRGLEVNTVLDRQRIVLEQLTGSARVASSMLKELIDFDVKTPFNIQDLSNAARMLKATGVVGNREVIPMVRKLADAAAGSGGGPEALEHIALAISQMLSKGKIQSEEMTRQLSNAGIPAWKLLADAMGKTVGEVQELSKEGKLGLTEINLLIDAMGKKYKGLAEKIGVGTIGDAFGVAKSRLDLLLAEATRPFKSPFIETMQMLVKGMESDAVKGIVKGVGDFVEMVGRAAQFLATNPFGQAIVAFTAISAAAMLVAGSIAGIVGGLVALAIAAPAALIPLGAIIAAAPPIAILAAAVTALGASFAAAFNSKEGAAFRESLGVIYSRVKDIAAEVAGGLMEALQAAANVLGGMFGDANVSVWTQMANIVKEMVTELLVWAKVFKEIMTVMRQQSQKTSAQKSMLGMAVASSPAAMLGSKIRDPFGFGKAAREDIAVTDKLRVSQQKLAEAEERRLKGIERIRAAQEDTVKAVKKLFDLETMRRNAEKAGDTALKATGGNRGIAGILGGLGSKVANTKGGIVGIIGQLIGFEQSVAARQKANAEAKMKEKVEKEAEFRDKLAAARAAAPAAIRKGLLAMRTFPMADQLAAGNRGLFGQIGKAIGGAVNAIGGAGKGAGNLLADAFGGENTKPRSGFTGIAEMSRQIQESILSADEKKDRKAMVKHLGGIDKGVAAVKGVVDDALKWIGKAL